MCRLRNIAMCDYQESVTNGQTDRHRTKWSLCAAMLCRRHKNLSTHSKFKSTTASWWKRGYRAVCVFCYFSTNHSGQHQVEFQLSNKYLNKQHKLRQCSSFGCIFLYANHLLTLCSSVRFFMISSWLSTPISRHWNIQSLFQYQCIKLFSAEITRKLKLLLCFNLFFF